MLKVMRGRFGYVGNPSYLHVFEWFERLKTIKVMYYQEKIIKGVLHYRTFPQGKFVRMSQQMLTKKIVELENQLLNK